MRKLIIHTENVCPPIPLRSMDWQATEDGYEPGHPIGTGPTEEAAVLDLIEQLFEEAAA
ncbi:hypothetical protein [Hyphomonas sp. CY54-11-8]|uniref:hypothetical protein n=1 Tax=Hyphomonas sp. CY54-11-8 TaxID=1280944 RepID=UPI000458E41B|nr:hypothetical protein [Hyphomonas sp. CY54-11-8]KCZ47743.1 hypothetical protein HY17_04505 [Hyphomonas sp. CY54-11-8]